MGEHTKLWKEVMKYKAEDGENVITNVINREEVIKSTKTLKTKGE